MRRRTTRLAALVRAAGCGLVVAAAPLGAQQQEPPTDSTRLRIYERLQRLGRGPGADSALFLEDSLRTVASQGARGAGGSSSDSTVAALLRMPGFTLTEYEGERARFQAGDRILRLEAGEQAKARVTREGQRVEADSSITYDETSGRVATIGASVFTPQAGDPVESANLIYDLQTQRGSAFGARTSYAQGSARWNVTGDMPFATRDSTFMSHARFTSCELEVPHYHFATDEIKIVGNKVLVARPVRLYFADVPVFWLPFIAQSLSSGRSSGLLTPRFSVNDIVRTSGGYNRRVSNLGFYWAMSEYTDAVVAVDWFSENFLSLTSGLQYRWTRQFLDGSINFRRYWQEDGSTSLALDTRHSWEMDERTRFSASGRYSSDTDLVRDYSFDPREVTQSIDSQGGMNRRFDWGALSLQATRKEFLSDDRVEWTLPSASLSLSTITLFRAPSNRAKFWNNMTWSGSTNYTRRSVDRKQLPDAFDRGLLNTGSTTTGASSSLSLGRLTLSQRFSIDEKSEFGVPEAFLALGDSADDAALLTGPVRDLSVTNLTWSASAGFQKNLIGSTTFTPRLGLAGSQLRSDTDSLASSFVSAPTKVTFGADLKSDLYRFYPGFGSFDRVRHKVSPSIGYDWSPGRQPTALQEQVFGRRVLQPVNAISLGLNNTFEAKRDPPPDSTAGAEEPPEQGLGSVAGEPRRIDRGEVVTLLAVNTSVVEYDFVEADSAGSFLFGFERTTLSNTISSDYLRGLSLSVEHDLFEDVSNEETGPERTFAPHLQSLNASFSLNSRSSIFRWLGFFRGSDQDDPLPDEELEDDLGLEVGDPLVDGGVTDENTVVPSERTGARNVGFGSRGSNGGSGWNASLQYALQRPRNSDLPPSQTLNGTLTLHPTEKWDLSWRTSYDLERGEFNDHMVRLVRDLHRWKANFNLNQAPNGNWRFTFEVSLIDNQDLKFDYEQRNLERDSRSSR